MSSAAPPPQKSLPPPSGGGANPPPMSKPSWVMFLLLGALLIGSFLWQSHLQQSGAPSLDYSAFLDAVEDGRVASVTLRGQTAQGTYKSDQGGDKKDEKSFTTMVPHEDKTLLPLLREHKVTVRIASEEQPVFVEILMAILPWALIIGLWMWLSRRTQRMMTGAGGPLGGFMKTKSRRFEKSESVNVTFADVAGLKSAKQDLEEVVGFLKEPERFRRLGGKVPRGVLLIGPPGTGKTLLARAVAGESGVPFYTISASEFIEMFVGVGAARVRELFEEAKKNAPAIIFIDEIDAVGRSRGAGLGGGHDEREQTLNQLLSEMDGFSRNDLTIVLAATNRPDVLDPALLRPGRFDRRVLVGRPELEARRAILNVHTREMPLAEDVDLESIARNTPGFSGADLANLANEAALSATRRGADSIFARDFREAYDKIVLGDPREGKLDAKEKHRVAVHESGHAVVAHFVEHAEPLHRVSIIPRGEALGVTQQTPGADRHLQTQPELEARLMVMMGGYAAERTVLGDVSTGASNDLREATKLATQMVAHFGMSKKLGAVYYEHEMEHPFLGQRIATEAGTSDATISSIETEARAVLAHALHGAEKLLTSRRDKLDALVDTLSEHETIERKELVEVLGEPHSALAAS